VVHVPPKADDNDLPRHRLPRFGYFHGRSRDPGGRDSATSSPTREAAGLDSWSRRGPQRPVDGPYGAHRPPPPGRGPVWCSASRIWSDELIDATKTVKKDPTKPVRRPTRRIMSRRENRGT